MSVSAAISAAVSSSSPAAFAPVPVSVPAAVSVPLPPVSVLSAFAGRTVLLTGVSGFVGMAVLEKLLRTVPNVARIVVLIRDRKGRGGGAAAPLITARERFERLINTNPLFVPLRMEWTNKQKAAAQPTTNGTHATVAATTEVDTSKEAADDLKRQSNGAAAEVSEKLPSQTFDEYVSAKVHVLNGDIELPQLGLAAAAIESVRRMNPIIIHAAASINFLEPLSPALITNTVATYRMMKAFVAPAPPAAAGSTVVESKTASAANPTPFTPTISIDESPSASSRVPIDTPTPTARATGTSAGAGACAGATFVHVSTAFVNHHLPQNSLEVERLYDIPNFPVEKALAEVAAYSDGMDGLVGNTSAEADTARAAITRRWNAFVRFIEPFYVRGGVLNTYLMSKWLAERVVLQLATGSNATTPSTHTPPGTLKAGSNVCIVRCAIVTPTMQEPYPGWVEGFAAGLSLVLAMGSGFAKFYPLHANTSTDAIPVDFVVNTLLVAAAAHATGTGIDTGADAAPVLPVIVPNRLLENPVPRGYIDRVACLKPPPAEYCCAATVAVYHVCSSVSNPLLSSDPMFAANRLYRAYPHLLPERVGAPTPPVSLENECQFSCLNCWHYSFPACVQSLVCCWTAGCRAKSEKISAAANGYVQTTTAFRAVLGRSIHCSDTRTQQLFTRVAASERAVFWCVTPGSFNWGEYLELYAFGGADFLRRVNDERRAYLAAKRKAATAAAAAKKAKSHGANAANGANGADGANGKAKADQKDGSVSPIPPPAPPRDHIPPPKADAGMLKYPAYVFEWRQIAPALKALAFQPLAPASSAVAAAGQKPAPNPSALQIPSPLRRIEMPVTPASVTDEFTVELVHAFASPVAAATPTDKPILFTAQRS